MQKEVIDIVLENSNLVEDFLEENLKRTLNKTRFLIIEMLLSLNTEKKELDYNILILSNLIIEISKRIYGENNAINFIKSRKYLQYSEVKEDLRVILNEIEIDISNILLKKSKGFRIKYLFKLLNYLD